MTAPDEPAVAVRIKWRQTVAEHDYAAAAAYLSLELGDDADEGRCGACTMRSSQADVPMTSCGPRDWPRRHLMTPL